MGERKAWAEASTIQRGKIDVHIGTDSNSSALSFTREEALELWKSLGALLQAPKVPVPASPDSGSAMSAQDFEPMFGTPVTAWWRVFAWHPTWTADRGWVWLRMVSRRRVVKHSYLPGGGDFWFQHAVRPDSGEGDR